MKCGCASQIVRATALLGYVPIGNMGLVLLATRIRDVLTLPGGHAVKLVVESKWFTVPLQARHSFQCCASTPAPVDPCGTSLHARQPVNTSTITRPRACHCAVSAGGCFLVGCIEFTFHPRA